MLVVFSIAFIIISVDLLSKITKYSDLFDITFACFCSIATIVIIFIAIYNPITKSEEIKKAEQELKVISMQEVIYIKNIKKYDKFLNVDKYLDINKPIEIEFIQNINLKKQLYIWDLSSECCLANIENI